MGRLLENRKGTALYWQLFQMMEMMTVAARCWSRSALSIVLNHDTCWFNPGKLWNEVFPLVPLYKQRE